MKQKISHIFCIILGIVCIISGIGKVVNTAAFGNLIVQYGFKHLHLLAPFIALGLVGVGLCLVLGIRLKKEVSDTKKMIVLGVMLPMIFVAGLTYQMPNFNQPNQQHLLNKHIKDTPLSQFLQTDSNKSYLVFFYSYTCPHAWNSIQNLKHFEQEGVVDSIIPFALIGTDFSGGHIKIWTEFVNFFGNFGTQEIVKDSTVLSLIPFIPTSFYIRNDTIRRVMVGTLPSPFTFLISQMSN